VSVDNRQIADRLDVFAALLELAEANPYSARAYRRAADTIRGTALPVAELVASGRIRQLRGIGPGIESKLRELIETGQIAELAELERELAPDLVGLGRYLGLSAKRSVALARSLDVHTADELREAAADGRLRDVPGIGPKTEAQLLEGLAREDGDEREGLMLNRARELAGGIAEALGGIVAGDVRRWRESCSMLAVVCTGEAPDLIDRFGALPQVVALISRGRERAVGVTIEGVPVQLVVTSDAALGTALVRATGPDAYVAGLGQLPQAADEQGVFTALGLPWRPPELRETGASEPPADLLTIDAIRGDLHMHTTWSDGRASVLEMGQACAQRGYEYLAICDHTPAVGAVRGLSADDVRRQAAEITAANERLAPFRILRGIECDILPDGRLDLPDDVLAELDWVQASVHGGQRMPAREMTRRVEAALLNPNVESLSHPTGRYVNRRPENAVDLDRVYELAVSQGIAIEVNGLPARLDLSGEHVRDALAAGARIVCNTDAHSVLGLDNMKYAVATARRGGAGASQVVNTLGLDELLASRRRVSS
jgi:DNA polymerase (family 10)